MDGGIHMEKTLQLPKISVGGGKQTPYKIR